MPSESSSEEWCKSLEKLAQAKRNYWHGLSVDSCLQNEVRGDAPRLTDQSRWKALQLRAGPREPI